MRKRIESVFELAKYKIGDKAYWIILRPLENIEPLSEDDQWMDEHHPKATFTRGPAKKAWPHRAMLPKLHHSDFEIIVHLLRSELVIEEFEVNSIVRSKDTGEFFYVNEHDEWMPESYLFPNDSAAKREQNRINKLIRQWAKNE